MIPVQSVVTTIQSRLQDELGIRYSFEEDIREAINSATDWMVMVFNAAMGRKKISGEVLRELVVARVWQASPFNRISFDEVAMGHKLWTILNVMPDPVVAGDASPQPPMNISRVRLDLRFVSSPHSASRKSFEQWNNATGNPFMAGGPVINIDLVDYAYQEACNYDTLGLPTGAEIEVSPPVPGASRLVAVRYLRRPRRVELITDMIELPAQIQEVLIAKASSIVSIKEGDGTTLYSVSEKDISTLIQVMAP